MSRIEAKWLLLRSLVAWRRRPYEELRDRIDREDHIEVRGRSGTEYQIEILILWDDQPEGDIRVLGTIDDGRWRACCPLAYGLLIPSPDRGPGGMSGIS